MVKLYTMFVTAFMGLGACKSEISADTQSAKTAPVNASIENSKEECGTVLVSKGKIYLQIVSNNSDKNTMPELKGNDVETNNALQAMAEKLSSACISGDFSKEVVTIPSISAIRQ
jgi:hypothetical protein